MADTPVLSSTPTAGMKRSRDDDDGDELGWEARPRFEKKSRPTSSDSNPWPQDSVLNTPTATSATSHPMSASYGTNSKPKYDSDDQSSMMSEPGSPQDMEMSTDDEDMADDMPMFSQSPDDMLPSSSIGMPNTSWQARIQRTTRVPTPILPPDRPGARPIQQIGGPRHHMRQRHPQENLSSSSDHLEVPSPIDEDEIPTPPSAAEAAGSQLSMLTVNDMEMEPPPVTPRLPSISIDTSEALGQEPHNFLDDDTAIADDMMEDSDAREPRLIVRKQRQRSGALSTPSPSRVDANARRGFSMGFRADCEKCRMRVPGHMNHFVLYDLCCRCDRNSSHWVYS